MNGYLMKMFCGSLALTLVTELAVIFPLQWFLCKNSRRGHLPDASGPFSPDRTDTRPTRSKRANILLLVILVNVLTNPPAVLLCRLGRLFLQPAFYRPVQLAVEAAVVIVEARVYCSFAEKEEWRMRRPVLMAVTANVCSWLLGILLSG